MTLCLGFRVEWCCLNVTILRTTAVPHFSIKQQHHIVLGLIPLPERLWLIKKDRGVGTDKLGIIELEGK
jgi:hypothetical protein